MIAEIFFEHTAPTAAIVAAIVVGVGLALFWFWRYLPVKATTIALALLRVGFIGVLAWCLLRPLAKHSVTNLLKPRFLVVLDKSQSMKLSPKTGVPNRWAAAQRVLAQPWTKTLGAATEIDGYAFAADTGEKLALSELSQANPDGPSTNLHEALRKIAERYRGQPLAGILLLTDGIDTREVNDDWATATWPCPIYTVRLETALAWEEAPDVRISRLETPRRVVVGWDSKLTAVVSGQGTKGQPINVQLLENGRLLQELPTQVPADGGSREVAFHLEHPVVGNFTYLVNLPPLRGEVVTNDNSFAVNVQVIDSKNRLLYLEGAPRFEAKFLARALLANKTVTPLIFLQGPNHRFYTVGPQTGTTADMAPEQLARYKIVVLGDLDAEALGTARAQGLVKFVEDGGSLVLLGGPQAWGANGFAATPLEKVMPVHRPQFLPPREGRFTVSLTAEGRAHPAFASEESAWKTAPPVLSIFPGSTLTPGAVAIVATTTDEGRQPVIAAQRFGQGKVAAVLTDSLWRWQLAPGQEEVYQRFWNQMMQWLLPAEQELQQYELDLFADTDQLFLGDALKLGATLGGPKGTTPPAVAVTCEIRTADDRRLPFPMTKQNVTTSSGKTFPGYGLEFTAQRPGLHTAVARADVAGRKVESAPFSFYIKPFTPESNPRPADTELLRALATASGGKFCEAAEVNQVLGSLKPKSGEEERITYSSLWNTLPILACLVGLLTIEWVVRKLNNLA